MLFVELKANLNIGECSLQYFLLLLHSLQEYMNVLGQGCQTHPSPWAGWPHGASLWVGSEVWGCHLACRTGNLASGAMPACFLYHQIVVHFNHFPVNQMMCGSLMWLLPCEPDDVAPHGSYLWHPALEIQAVPEYSAEPLSSEEVFSSAKNLVPMFCEQIGKEGIMNKREV